jgi:DnaJ-class molecular chaperone
MTSLSFGLRGGASPRIIGCRKPACAAGKADAITLPLDAYKLLQVNRASSRDLVRRSYDRIVKAPLPGYSEDALFSRAVLLKSACDVLSDPDARRSYDQKLFKEMQQ